jgi:nicotinamidase-related amidase
MSLGRLNPANTVLLVCDIQERFRDVIWKFDSVIRTSKLLVDGCGAIGVPIVCTEQYPKALGKTVQELTAVEYPKFPKMDFSMATPEVLAHIKSLGGADKQHYIIVGLETHVCVLQTTLDLLAQGKNVHVAVDAVSSSRSTDRAVALKRMENAGAYLTTAESVLFMLMGSANYANFKPVSNLVKEYGKRPSELPFGSSL